MKCICNNINSFNLKTFPYNQLTHDIFITHNITKKCIVHDILQSCT